jgi:serine/threonine protein phosphatase PrpC
LDNAPPQMGTKVGNGVGCTANVLLMTPDKYYIANAGDSRSALYRDGKLVVFS